MQFAATKLHIFLRTVSARNSTLMCLASHLGKNKAPIVEVLAAKFKSFKCITKNPSKADDSRS